MASYLLLRTMIIVGAAQCPVLEKVKTGLISVVHTAGCATVSWNYFGHMNITAQEQYSTA